MQASKQRTSGKQWLTLAALSLMTQASQAACNGPFDSEPAVEDSFATAHALGEGFSASSGCDAYAAPVLVSNMQGSRDVLRDAVLRLERLRAAGLATGKSSLYVTGALPAYRHVQGTYTRRHDLIVGVDHRFNEQWVAGTSAGLAQSAISDAQGEAERLDGTGGTLLVYASWSPTQASYISAALGLDALRYQLNRETATGHRLRANAVNTGLSLSAGYDVNLSSWTLSPFVRTDHIVSRVGAFIDTDSASKGRTSSTSIGAQLATQVSMNWGVLSPHVRVEGTHLHGWSLKGDSVQAYRDVANAYGIRSMDDTDRQYGQFGLGAAALFQGGLTVFGDMDKTFAMKGVTSWRFTLGLRGEL